MRFWVLQKIKTGNNIYSFILTAEDFNGRINLEPQSVQLYEIMAQKKKLPTLSTNSEMSPKSTRLATSNISIRDMLRDVKNVASKLYINANGSENFMFNQFAVWINKRGAAVRWLTAPANRMPDGNGNPAISDSHPLYIYYTAKRTEWQRI